MARASRDEWAARVREWKQSGLTAESFAARLGLNASTLLWWSSRLNRAGGTSPALVEIVGAAVADEARCGFEVVLPGGVRVLVPMSFDTQALRRVLQAVREA